MHIHGGQMNPNLSSSVSEAALAARRAESTRKKLSSAAFELDSMAAPESAWSVQMAEAWPDGGQGGKSSDPSANPPAPERNTIAPRLQSSTAEVETYRDSVAAPVSFWA